jgi:hypothetical protein
VIALLLTTLALAGGGQAPERAVPVAAVTRCAEDDACWTWSRMGNRRRGIVTRWGTPLVVGPCRFARLRRAGRVDYPRFARMKGDAWAMQHGCRR